MAWQLSRLERLNGIQYSWVQIPLRTTFYSYFQECFTDEYHMYQFIPLHSFDYLSEISLKENVATDEGNGRNETWILNKDMKLEQLYKDGSELMA